MIVGRHLPAITFSAGPRPQSNKAGPAKGQFDHPESTLRTAGADIARLVDLSRDLDIGCAWPRFASSIFQRAIDDGLGDKEHCAITNVLRGR